MGSRGSGGRRRPRAAYVQLRSEYFGRPFDDGVVGALLEAGYEVDLFAPRGGLAQDLFPGDVRRLDIEFSRAWVVRNLGASRWRGYDLFLGNPDLGTALGGLLAAVTRRPFVNACEEIYVGGYRGTALGWWRGLARWAARRADFTIITDVCRTPLQRDFAALPPDHRFLPYPTCFASDYAGAGRERSRQALGIADGELVVSVTGALTDANGFHWVVEALDGLDGRLLIQPGAGVDACIDALLRRLERDGRVLYRPEVLPWPKTVDLTAAADVGVVLYLSSKSQFQHMGVSSQKLDTYLWLGIPVVARRQPSFEFLRERGCGELIDEPHQLAPAVRAVFDRRGPMSEAARRTVPEYIRPAECKQRLVEEFARLASRGRSVTA
jgi:hypothetical protein